MRLSSAKEFGNHSCHRFLVIRMLSPAYYYSHCPKLEKESLPDLSFCPVKVPNAKAWGRKRYILEVGKWMQDIHTTQANDAGI